VLHGARVDTGAVVAVGALVHGGTGPPSGFFLAQAMFAIGDPVATYAPGDPWLADAIRGWASPSALGVSTAWEDRVARYRRIADVRSKEFAARWRRSGGAVEHLHDTLVILSNDVMARRDMPVTGRNTSTARVGSATT
jgi:hypothetical protein